MHKSDFRKLLSFYLDCLEEEDLRSLSFNISQTNQAFVLGGDGSFLLTGSETQFPLADSYFMRRNESATEESERLFLGYPILVYDKRVSPLYFIEVDVKNITDSVFSLTVADTSCSLNHHLFGKNAQDIEESVNLLSEFECDLANLQDSLTKASDHFDVRLEDQNVLEKHDLTSSNPRQHRWASNFILFRGGRSAVNAMLKRDIQTFLRYPTFIDNVDSTALDSLLNDNQEKDSSVDNSYKFSRLNEDQKQAVNAGLSQKLTVVTGPPGTGKSQVVANILASCAYNKKSVLFASKNNKAVDVVFDKLRVMLGEDNWVLRLGSREKSVECNERIMAQLGAEHEVVPNQDGINANLLEIEQKLGDILKIRSQIDKLQSILAGYESSIRLLEANLDSTWIAALACGGWSNKDDEIKRDIDKCRDELSGLVNRGFSSLWLRIIAYFTGQRLRKHYSFVIEQTASLYLEDIAEVTYVLRENNSFTCLYELFNKLASLLDLKYFYFERNRLEDALSKLPPAQELKEQENKLLDNQVHLYQQKLRESWNSQIQEKRPALYALFRRYFSAVQEPPVTREGWKSFSDDFVALLDDFYVWIVTNLSARRSIPLEAKAFDVVVIDEASQCDILSALPLLYRAKRVIIIGDPNQLKNITLINSKTEAEIAAKHGIEKLLATWSYRRKSIYDVAESKLLDAGKMPRLLSLHYRCHPDIIGFSNSALYKNKLTAKTDIQNLEAKFRKNELGVFWHDVKGRVPESSNSAYNQSEVDYIINLIDSWRMTIEANAISIGIVTPFKKQVERLQAAVDAKKAQWGELFVSSIVIGTAHRFQGDECDLIFFSPVVSAGIKSQLASWVASTEELINVAVTRARGALHVVGDEDSCRKAGALLEALVIYIQNCHARKGLHFGYESPAEEIVGEILTSLDLPFFTQVEKGQYRLDFIVTTPFGNKINLEVDGRQHYSAEHVAKDEVRDRYITELGYKVIRVNAKDVFARRAALEKRLGQVV